MKRHRPFFVPWGLLVVLLVANGGHSALAAVDPITGAEPAEGFGASATGGHGKEEVIVTTLDQLTRLKNRSDVYIRVRGNITATDTTVFTGSNLTIDGEGAATLRGIATPSDRGQRMLEFTGKNIVVKNIRLRVAGDNLSFKRPAERILVSHVSTTGAYDDGMSISYGTKNVTVQYCVFFGCTRSCFIKYDTPQNISLHHNWFKGQYMRGPLVSTAYKVDVRNQIGEDWWMWGGPRFEKQATGNCINSFFVMTGATPGKRDAADYTYGDGGPAYFHGSVYRGCSGRPANSTTEIPCAPVTTHSAAEAQRIVRANAGCLPRDAIDRAYIAATSWPALNDTHPWIIEIQEGDPD
jgi:hypothetical protein